jgi:integrase/recombinase XerD
VGQLTGPLLATTGGRLRQGHLWELVRRLARVASIQSWQRLSPHSLQHSAITVAFDAGATLRDVQDYAGHNDPRTTRRYDHSRDSLTATPPTPSPPTSPDHRRRCLSHRGSVGF